MTSEQPLWKPSPEAVARHPLTAFARRAETLSRRPLPSFAELHAWSIDDRGGFWDLLWDFCGVVGSKGDRRLADGDRMPGARFFPDAVLNFAENLLRRS